jgi:hypothetical protein
MTLRFYEEADDIYDFLIVFNDFLKAQQQNEKASYRVVNNQYQGNNKILIDRSRFHGSRGRLKGIVNMNKIDQYSVSHQAGLVSLLNLIHHEILHHWGASVSFIDSSGNRNWSLLADDKNHWSRWVDWVSPLGGWGWNIVKELNDGQYLFRSARGELQGDEIIQFPAIDLYLMGLYPERFMPLLGYVIPEDKQSVSDEVVGSYQVISIDNIISSHGKLACSFK